MKQGYGKVTLLDRIIMLFTKTTIGSDIAMDGYVTEVHSKHVRGKMIVTKIRRY